ncbi:hypothetical protein [Pseudonocardia alni]|uniref:hypothetical protein n=1 Tax=Pseudonocardia alni TaxID=33907 RepID=UPI00280B8CD4|nr:hypothetical protein [Pseudonocardia alni]
MAGTKDDSADNTDVRFDRLLALARRPDDFTAPQYARPWSVGEIAAALATDDRAAHPNDGTHEVTAALLARPAPRSPAFLGRLSRLLGAPASYFDPRRAKDEVEAELLVEQLRRCGVTTPLICRARLSPPTLVQTLEIVLELLSTNPPG